MLRFKFLVQRALKQAHLYERAKASCLYDLFWTVADRRVIDERNRELEFYRNVLEGFRRRDLVFDIGANAGFKTDIFLRLGARVVAVEPDESNLRILAEKFLKYRIVKKPVLLVAKAVTNKKGFETFWVDELGSAKNTLNKKWVKILQVDQTRFGAPLSFNRRLSVETIQLEDLINVYGPPFFIKVDVEGSEVSVLEGLQRPVPYLSFEVNLPEFQEEGLTCLRLLEHLDPDGLFNYTVDSQAKLAAQEWKHANDFQQVLANCTGKSIDVFWKTMT